jgi:two-component system response regulator AtoC
VAGIAIEPAAVERLKGEAWPGNVRQLQNFVERLVVLADGPVIGSADVARELARGTAIATPGRTPVEEGGGATLETRRREAERQALKEALDRVQGNRTRAARILGVSRRTLYNMLETHGMG